MKLGSVYLSSWKILATYVQIWRVYHEFHVLSKDGKNLIHVPSLGLSKIKLETENKGN